MTHEFSQRDDFGELKCANCDLRIAEDDGSECSGGRVALLLGALKLITSLAKTHVADAEDWHEYQYALKVIAEVEKVATDGQ